MLRGQGGQGPVKGQGMGLAVKTQAAHESHRKSILADA